MGLDVNPDWKVDQDDEEFDRSCKNGSEDGEQIALMGWAARAIFHQKFPELCMLHAVPNGGQRDAVVGAKLKATGVRAGVPDLFLDVARHGMHGLRIEMKRSRINGGRPSDLSEAQKVWRDRYFECGYGWALALGWKEARDILVAYLTPS